jgi:DNA-binding MarR family transcriptional regulator
MSPDPARDGDRPALANVLGAVALVVTDEMSRAVVAAADQVRGSVTDAATLAAFAQFLDGATLDRVHRVLGLTPSGAVRLVDRLEAAGLVVREAGSDGRSRAVRLTESGRDRARAVHAARSSYLTRLVGGLSDDEVVLLQDLLGRVMADVVEEKEGGAWTCRLCDLQACGRDDGRCPAANAARARYGAPA